METRYEVQTSTICDGWITTWSIIAAAAAIPETFATRDEAQEALDEFLSDIQSEIDAGQRTADEAYDPDDFRIAEVEINAPADAP